MTPEEFAEAMKQLQEGQGQLQGANMSVASIAGVMSPLFFGWVYSISAGEGAPVPPTRWAC